MNQTLTRLRYTQCWGTDVGERYPKTSVPVNAFEKGEPGQVLKFDALKV
jgi:hypothetical protein